VEIVKVDPSRFYIKDYSPLLSVLKAFGFDIYDVTTTYHTAFCLMQDIGAATISGVGENVVINAYPQEGLADTYNKWCVAARDIQKVANRHQSLFSRRDYAELLGVTWGLVWIETEKARLWLHSAGYAQRLSLPGLEPLRQADSLPAGETVRAAPEADPAKGEASHSGKSVRKPRMEVSQQSAAIICKVNPRTVQRWESGRGTPTGYPGRYSFSTLKAWSESEQGRRALNAKARQINKAVPMDPHDIENMEGAQGWPE
jgi:DNA-binding transcriptional regulator YiaG